MFNKIFATAFINIKLFFFFLIFVNPVLPTSLIAQSVHFNHLTTGNGLSNNYVYDIIQDRKGFLWFATDDGLNRFDGYDFKIFRNNPADINTITDNSIWVIIEDENGKIWIGTKNGFVNCYDPVLDKFSYWEIKSNITKENPITAIFYEHQSAVWIGTYRSGLYKLDPTTGKINNWASKFDDSSTISNNYITSIVKDDNENFWIGSYNGLNKFNPHKSKDRFQRYFNDKVIANTISNNVIWAINQSSFDKNKFWVGTADGITILQTNIGKFSRIPIPNNNNIQFGTGAGAVIEEMAEGDKILWTNSYAGLIRINLTANNFERILSDKKNPTSLLSNQTNKVFKDRSGVLWIATDDGLSYLSEKHTKFNYQMFQAANSFNPKELSTQNVKAIVKTVDGTLWFGTDNGLYYSRILNGSATIEIHPAFISENIWSLAAGNSNDLWIGTYGTGLYQFNYQNNRISKINLLDSVTRASSRNFIKSVLWENNNLWVGYWGLGLVRLNLSTGKVSNWIHSSSDKYSLSHDDVWVIYKDSKSRIWLGTNGGGLNLFEDSNGGKFHHISHSSKNKTGLSSNSIYAITESKKKLPGNNNIETILWVGTDNGLNKLIISDSRDLKSITSQNIIVTHYTIANGLADNSIKSITEDDNGTLWLGTSSGITFYNPIKNIFINFSTPDGVVGKEFNLTSALKHADDLIFMGSTTGLNFFNPYRIEQSKYKPSVVITDFQIFNSSVKIAPNTALTKNIFYTDIITLSHTQNVFSFQFSAMDYNNPNSIKYTYKMEGFDKDWISSGDRRFITYTNLYPGEYTFKVKSTNSDGVWNNNETSLKLIITPPWWQTQWAIALYFIVFVLGIWRIIKFQSNRTRLQNELKMREFESYNLREIEKMKSRFFANLSHEFRTPLMLIKSPIQELISGRIKDKIPEYYQMLLNNTEKLQQLIDQLLELSQLETQSIPLKTDICNLVETVKSLTLSFLPLAEQKNIKLNFNSYLDSALALIDKDKLEKIINNLLSNAFKFTPEGGIITVEILNKENNDNQYVQLYVRDTGIGISKEHQEKIFDRFYQVDSSMKRSFGGSGIGLALVKELTTLHKWDISVNSHEGEGTEFLINIPLLSEHEYQDLVMKNLSDKKIETAPLNSIGQIDFENEKTIGNTEKPTLLVVEDSDEVRKYIYDLLVSDYNVLLANNGKSGIDIAQNNMPQLIISDIMMPGMDGFEFCKKIKTDWKTSHIPIILLTAKATQQSKIEGLETGADDYITKPFNFDELFVRIKNLITQRNQLHEKFSKDIKVDAELFSSNSLDKEFIQKIIDVIEKNLNNEKFDSELLAKEIYVSRSQLKRKLHAIAGQGPGEFIRIYKLKRAAQMIIESKLSITQIALEVGFSSPSQFTRAFQKHFDYLPSEFNPQPEKNSKS